MPNESAFKYPFKDIVNVVISVQIMLTLIPVKYLHLLVPNTRFARSQAFRLGMLPWKLLLPEIKQAGACHIWVPKQSLRNQMHTSAITVFRKISNENNI